MEDLAAKIENELKANIDGKYKLREARLFKEGRKVYGVRTPVVRYIAKKYWKEIRNENKESILELCESLLSTGFHEPLIIAFQWACKCKKPDKADFKIFETWLEKYVNNWSSCDDLCSGPLGRLILDFPELMPRVFEWAKNKNM